MSGKLFHSPAAIIGKVLVDLGHGVTQSTGTTTSWQVYDNYEPDAPTNCITLYDTSSRQAGRLLTGEVQEMVGIQIRIRCATETEGRQKAENIKEALDKEILRRPVRVGETWYVVHVVQRTTEVSRLGVESSSRRRSWVINAVSAIRWLDEAGTGTATPTIP